VEVVWLKQIETVMLVDSRIQEAKRVKSEITLGADPELEFVDRQGNIRVAREVMSEHDTRVSPTAELGIDAAGGPVEIRPRPGMTGTEVVENIKRIMARATASYPGCDLSVKGDRHAIGLHIHLGVNFEARPPFSLVTIFDDLLARPVWSTNGAARGSYAQLSQHRSQPWGFEYRSLPSAVMATPEIMRIALDISKGIIKYYLSHDMVEYNDVPTVDDYVRITGITAEDAQQYLAFAGVYRTLNAQKIIANWTTPVPYVPPTPSTTSTAGFCSTGDRVIPMPGEVVFWDDWDNGAMGWLRQKLRSYMIRYDIHMPVVLYGLSQSRGMVCTIGIRRHDEILRLSQHQMPRRTVENGVMYIGIPYTIRIDHTVFNSMAVALYESIIFTIRRKWNELPGSIRLAHDATFHNPSTPQYYYGNSNRRVN
jgi:hypothetical protein